jgi:tRNA A-37 threonylcarbamoyl transferase component Bud32
VSSEPTDARAPVGGRYRVLRRAGAGACGEVFLALDEELGREVAVKLYREFPGAQASSALARFEREAKILAQHPHPAVVPIYDVDLRHQPPYVVLRWMEGGDFTRRMARGALDRAEVVALGGRIAGALEHLHEQDIIHRDVKPENLLLDAAGEVYLADLGLADALEEEGLTATGLVVGTPRYMAPELFEASSYSPASDVYSLGIVLLEAALGERLGFLPARDSARLQDSLKRVPDPALRRVLRSCLRSVPGERLGAVGRLALDLERLGDGGEAGPPDPARPGESTRTVELPLGHPEAQLSGAGGPPEPVVPASPVAPPGPQRPRIRRGRLLLWPALALAAASALGILLWPRATEEVPDLTPSVASPEQAALEGSIDTLEEVAERLQARKSRFRREHFNADTDSRELYLEDAPRMTDATNVLLWQRYLRAVEGFLRAARGLPEGREHRRVLMKTFDHLVLDRGQKFYSDIRRFELRAGALALRGRIGPLEVSEYGKLAKDRIREIREATRAWVQEVAGKGLAGDPGLLAVETEYLTLQENAGLLPAARRLLDVAAAHPDHALVLAVYKGARELFGQHNWSVDQGLVGPDCEELEEVFLRYHRQTQAQAPAAAGISFPTMVATWHCPGAAALRELARSFIPRARATRGDHDGKKRLCATIATRRREHGIPEPAREVTEAMEAAAGCS